MLCVLYIYQSLLPIVQMTKQRTTAKAMCRCLRPQRQVVADNDSFMRRYTALTLVLCLYAAGNARDNVNAKFYPERNKRLIRRCRMHCLTFYTPNKLGDMLDVIVSDYSFILLLVRMVVPFER